jgi:predicted outer membrane repeat protein
VTAAVGLSLAGASAALAAPAQGLYAVGCTVAALNTALASPSGSTLVLAKKCTYKTAAPLTTVTTNLTIVGNSDTITMTGAQTILTVTGGNLSLSHLTFTGGVGVKAAAGAIQNDGGTLTVTDATFTGNTATDGGAIRNDGGTLLATDSNFTDNSADGGGAIADYDVATTTVNGGSFSGNDAFTGGAIANVSGSLTVNASGSTQQTAFDDNLAEPLPCVIQKTGTRGACDARRMFARMPAAGSRPEIRPDHPFVTAGNGGIRPAGALYDGFGGAIANYVGPITVNNAAFTGDGAYYYGGGVANDGATSTVSNSGFTDGGAEYGGAVYAGGSAVNLTKTGVFSNTAVDVGGGVYSDCGTLTQDSTSFVTRNSPNNVTLDC